MLDFTWYVMFFNYCLTKMPGGAALTRPTGDVVGPVSAAPPGKTH